MSEIKIKPSHERDDIDLLELVCQLHSRALSFPSEKMHHAYVDARIEIEKRLKEYAKAYAPVPGKEEDQTYKIMLQDILLQIEYGDNSINLVQRIADVFNKNPSVLIGHYSEAKAVGLLYQPSTEPKAVQQAAKEETYKNLLIEIDKSLYIGDDLTDEDVLKWYIDVVTTIKEEIKEVLAGASFNSDDGKEDQYWSQAISMIEVADTDGNDYLQKYDELHKKLKSKFTITSNKNSIQQAHDKAQYE